LGSKSRVDRSPEQKSQIVREGMKSGNVSEACRRHGIAPNLFYRWRDEAEQGGEGSAWGEKRCRGGNREGSRLRQLERTLGRKSLEIEILKNVVGE
jgi:transposase